MNALFKTRFLLRNVHRLLSSASGSSGGVITDQSANKLRITEKAANQLNKIAKEGEHLRICVDSGGCSGFEYKLSLDNQLSEDDEVIVSENGATVVVDKMSLEFIKGSKLDFTEDLMRAAFRITDNPLATQGCSCGASFAPKEMAS